MEPIGNKLLLVFEALANPHRMRIVGALQVSRKYVSELAREMGMSRPLLYMHLKRLETAGLVVGNLELSDDGKAMKYYELTHFEYEITGESIAEASKSLKMAEQEKIRKDENDDDEENKEEM